MSTLGKVFAGLNIVAALAFFFLAVITLKAHNSWGEAVKNTQQQLDQVVEQVKLARWGQTQGGKLIKPGVIQQNTALHGLLVDRGRVWSKVVPGPIDAMTGGTTVEVAAPSPHQIVGGTILYVFDEKPRSEGGQYLGQFRVAGLEGETKVALAPAQPLGTEALQRVTTSQASGGTWALYEMMPRDRNELFATLDDAALQALIPAESLPEYQKDGKDAEPNDPVERVVKDPEGKAKDKYVRSLRDYAVLFRELDRQMAVLHDRVASAEVDQQDMQAALTDAQQHVEFERATIAQLKTELAAFQAELAAVKQHRETLTAGLATARAEMARLMNENKQLANQLATEQAATIQYFDQDEYGSP